MIKFKRVAPIKTPRINITDGYYIIPVGKLECSTREMETLRKQVRGYVVKHRITYKPSL